MSRLHVPGQALGGLPQVEVFQLLREHIQSRNQSTSGIEHDTQRAEQEGALLTGYLPEPGILLKLGSQTHNFLSPAPAPPPEHRGSGGRTARLANQWLMQRAFSLLETIFVVGLTLLVLTLAFRFVNQFLRIARLETLKSDMQQSVFISLGRIATDCSQTIPNGVSLRETSPLCVAFNAYTVLPNDAVVDGSGIVTWSDLYAVYYWEPSTREFRRFEWTPTDPAEVAGHTGPVRAKRLPPPLLLDLVTNRVPANVSRLARQVSLFQVEPSGGETMVRQPLRFTLEVQRQAPGRAQPIRFRFSRTVFLSGAR